MKMKRKTVLPPFEELMPLLIACWRKLCKQPGGPPNELQTREFRSFVDSVLALPNQGSLDDYKALSAHVLYEYPFYLAEGLSVLSELPELPTRTLDLFSGAAPFALAAKMFGAFESIAIDTSEAALRYAGEISGKMGMTLTCRLHDAYNAKLPVEGKFDLITIGHGLFKHFPLLEKQLDYIRKISAFLSEKGYLVFVESSVLEENRKMLALRDALVEKGYKVQAPCIWKGNCPALAQAGASCYAQRPIELPYLLKEVHRAAKINRNSLKMSYLIVRHPEASWPNIGDSRLYRIISAPIDTAKGKRHILCGVDGKKLLGTHLKIHPQHSKAYDFLKRGDVISIEKPLETKNDLELIEETQLKVVAAISKPLPEVE